MRRFRLIVITVLGALAVPLVAASGASADVYSCVFNGATGSITTGRADESGVESVATDLVPTAANPQGQGNEGDALAGDASGLTDTDNGTGGPGSWGLGASVPSASNDGSYVFDTSLAPNPPGNQSRCLFADSPAGPDADGNGAGVFPINILSSGQYENVVCGTGIAGSTESAAGGGNTDVVATGPGVPGGTFEPVTAADYLIRFAAGQGVLDINSATSTFGGATETGAGFGYVNIEPTGGGNCATVDVSTFLAQGAFVAGDSVPSLP